MKKQNRYRNRISKSLFESEDTHTILSNLGNPLTALDNLIDFEMFRPELEAALSNKERKSNAGRKPFEPVLMFKVLFLQRYYGLGDHQIQYQIVDRTSFRQFLGIESVKDVPDEKTVWKYKEALQVCGAYDRLFDMFRRYMEDRGLVFNSGKIVDASFVTAPRQRNTREENRQIKAGRGDELWNDNPHKKCHKDTDARWTKKRGETYYGYKNHSKVCAKTKIVLAYDTTSASVHDSKKVTDLITDEDKGKALYLDAGYVGKDDEVRKRGMTPVICEKGHRNRPLTETQKANNRTKSKVRSRVEHVFGFMEQSMHGLFVRTVGISRAKANTALTRLVYNICRFCQIVKYHGDWLATCEG